MSVEIKTLTVSGKQMTQALFRQLEIEDLITPELKLKGVPLGRVNYFPSPCNDKRSASHLHIVWQKGEELKRDCVYEQYPSEECLKPYRAGLESAVKGLFVAEIYAKPEDQDKRWTDGEFKIIRELDDTSLSLNGPWVRLVDAAHQLAYSHTQELIAAVETAREEAGRDYGLSILTVDQAAQYCENARSRLNSFQAGYRKVVESLKALPQLFVGV